MKIKTILKKLFLWGLILTLVLVSAVIGFIYYTSYSESGGRIVFKQSQEFLKDFFDINLSAKKFKIKPLRYWEFESLKVEKPVEEGETSFSIEIEKLKLGLDFSIFSQRLFVSEFHIKNSQISAAVFLEDEIEDDSSIEYDDDDEQSLNDVMLGLFLAGSDLLVKNILIENFRFDIEVKSDDFIARISQIVNGSGEFKFENQTLTSGIELNYKAVNSDPSFSYKLTDGAQEIGAQVSGKGAINIGLSYIDSSWRLKSEDTFLESLVSGIKLISVDQSKVTKILVPKAKTKFKFAQDLQASDISHFPFMILKTYGLSLYTDVPSMVFKSGRRSQASKLSIQKHTLRETLVTKGAKFSLEVPDLPGEQARLDLIAAVNEISGDLFKRKASLLLDGFLKFDSKLQKANLNLTTDFLKKRVLKFELMADVLAESLIRGVAETELPQEVVRQLNLPLPSSHIAGLRSKTVFEVERSTSIQSLPELFAVFSQRIDFVLQSNIDNPSKRIFSSMFANVKGQLIEGEPKFLNFEVESPKISYGGHRIVGLAAKGKAAGLKDIDISLDAQNVMVSGFNEFEGLNTTVSMQSESGFRMVKASGDMSISGNKNLSYETSLSRETGCNAKLDLEVYNSNELVKILKKKMDFIGQWSASLATSLQSTRSCEELSAVSSLGGFKSEQISLNLKASQLENGTGALASEFYDDIDIALNLRLGKRLEISSKASLPRFLFQGLAKSEAMSIKLQGDLDPKNLTSGKLSFEVDNGGMSLAKPNGGYEDLGPIRSEIRAELNQDKQLELPLAFFDVGKKFFRTRINGRYDIKRKTGLMQGRIQLQSVGKKVKTVLGEVQGKMTVPFELGVRNGRRLDLDGRVSFRNFVLSTGKFLIGKINGPINFKEQLVLNNGRAQFFRIIQRNPFERVEYKQVQPLLAKADQLKIERVQWEGQEFGPIYGYLSLNQNLLNIHSIDFVFPDGGHMDGEFSLDFRPSQLEIGFLNRLTQIRLSKILPKRFLKGIDQRKDQVSARTGLVFNLVEGQINGRVDVLEVSEDGLLSLLNVLDPEYQDDQINQARLGLGLAAPSSVTLVFNQGFLDLQIEFDALAVPGVSLYGIPVSQIMLSKLEGLKKLLGEIPLQ